MGPRHLKRVPAFAEWFQFLWNMCWKLMRYPGGQKVDVWKTPLSSIFLKNFGIQFPLAWFLHSSGLEIVLLFRATKNYFAVIAIPLLNKQSQISLLIAERTSLWVTPSLLNTKGQNNVFHLKMDEPNCWMHVLQG